MKPGRRVRTDCFIILGPPVCLRYRHTPASVTDALKLGHFILKTLLDYYNTLMCGGHYSHSEAKLMHTQHHDGYYCVIS